ncbi:MAG: TonB-dependent receptor plug domain-containing protein [Prevotella sp.]|nr:TonB-dependent receptor plug domain-containing protein [Prevotella sp.]
MLGMSTLLFLSTIIAPDESADTIRTRQLDEIVVSRSVSSQRVQGVQMGVEQLEMEDVHLTPALFGENDVLRALQLLPGVKAENEASSGFQVRGGTSAQNAILYDHVPVYNVGHLAGLFSAFNSDALSGATLYKGCPPPQFGGGSSAVLDVSSRSGRLDAWHGSGGVGLLSAKAMFEGPLDDRTSVLLCGRRSYIDRMLCFFDDFKDDTFYFFDVNARVDYQLSDRDQLRLSLFGSRDHTAVKDLVSIKWSNLAVDFSWRHHFRNNAHSQTSLLLSNYSTKNGIVVLGMDQHISEHIRQWGLREDFTAPLGTGKLTLGAQSMVVDVKSAEWWVVNNHEKEQRRAWENTLWAGIELKPLSPLTLQAGLRASAFSSLGGPYYYDISETGDIVWYYKTRRYHIVNTHFTVDPRLSTVWALNDQLSLKASYAHSSQNVHALRGQSTSTPFDRYTLSSNLIKPQHADQVSMGIYAMTPKQDYDFSIEGYYRHIDNILDYRDGKSYASAIEMERLVLPGQGRCYGAELLLRKNAGRLTGWLAYTLSWARNKIEGINEGRWYTSSVDRRHDIDILAVYQLTPHWKLSATWVYYSGQAFTAPSGKYELIDNYIYYYAERNGYRAPANHHLDLSATWTKHKPGSPFTREWQIGIYNVYNRYNPFIINFEDSEHGARTKAVGYSLFGIVPSVSFNITF